MGRRELRQVILIRMRVRKVAAALPARDESSAAAPFAAATAYVSTDSLAAAHRMGSRRVCGLGGRERDGGYRMLLLRNLWPPSFMQISARKSVNDP